MVGKSIRIPLEHLSSGIYFVQIKGDKQMITKRFVKE
ncbi:MAG: T9SS type A sorting domain-containing protein [Bacteroidales bacterium]|nr:T9SS type A sorting domain-containing protein [Bacteroidales bacterium]